MSFVIVELVALTAATLAGVTGFGGAAVLLPVLVLTFGARSAIPILTIAQIVGNGSRVWLHRQAIQLRVVGWFALGAVPFALAGGLLFARVSSPALDRIVGGFLLVVVVWRHVRPARRWTFASPWFAAIGAGFSFLSALLGGVGPLMAPFFLAYGLAGSAFIGTEALATLAMHATKVVAYRSAAVLGRRDILRGLALAPAMVLGSYVGKQVVSRLPKRAFVALVEVVMLVFGLRLLAGP